MIEEIWKDIEGYEGKYQVSNMGRVRSHCYGEWKILKQNIASNRTARVHLGGPNNTVNVHRLVAQAFIPNPDNLPQINHKDENRSNNCVDNLEWCDNTYNLNYGTRNKRASESIKKAWRNPDSNYKNFYDIHCTERQELL